MGAAESLTAWGIVRAPEVVQIAAGAGLELASAAAMLEKETSGGQNLWGRDGVDTGGFYVKGSPVTRGAYEAWRPHRARLGSQGVGPCQLTYPPLQDQADRLGGCWDWRINVTVGFRHLAGLQKQFGIRDGFRRYNGSGPAAEAYADSAMAKRQKWIDRLGSRQSPLMAAPTALPSANAPEPAPAPEDDVMYIKYAHTADDIWYALLAGPIFVGLGTAGEKASADAAIRSGATVQWVESWTWSELDRRSHALCDNPRPITVVHSSVGPTSPITPPEPKETPT